MSLMDELGGLLKKATGGNASEADVHAAYDQVSTAVPKSDLADGLAHASSPTRPLPSSRWSAVKSRSLCKTVSR